MSDYISREAAAKREKIKTPFARIIVDNNPKTTYYNIMWWQDGEMHIGFGSASLPFVRKWLSEEFEVDNPLADVEPVRHGRWEGYIHSRYCGIDADGEPVYRELYTTAPIQNAEEKP